MAFTQIAGIAPNFRDYKNDWLKAYEPGTTAPKLMSDNDTGSPTVAKYEINADGFPVSSGGAIVIPHIDGDYDLWLFPTEAEADANDTTNAIRLADDIENYLTSSTVGDAIGGFVTYDFDTVTNAKNGQTIGGETVTLEVGDVIRIKERGSALFDVIAGTGTANTYNIIAHATLNISFSLRVSKIIKPVEWGAIDGQDATSVLQEISSNLTSYTTVDFENAEYFLSASGLPADPFGHRIFDLNNKDGIRFIGNRARIKCTNHDVANNGGLMFVFAKACNDFSASGFDFDMSFTGINTSSSFYPWGGAFVGNDGSDADAGGVRTQGNLNGNWKISDCTFKMFHPSGQFAQSGTSYLGDPNNGFKIFPISVFGPFDAVAYANQCRKITIDNCTLKEGGNSYGFWTWAWNDVSITNNTAESFVAKQSNQSGVFSGRGEPFIRYHQFHCTGLTVIGNDFRAKPCSERVTSGFEGSGDFMHYNTNLLGNFGHGKCSVSGNVIMLGRGDDANAVNDWGVYLIAYGSISVVGNSFDESPETTNARGGSVGIYWNAESVGGQGNSTLSVVGNTWNAACDYQNNIVISNGGSTKDNRRLKQLTVNGNTTLGQSQYFVSMSNTGTSYGVQDLKISENLISGEFNILFDKNNTNSRAIEVSGSETTDMCDVSKNVIRGKYYGVETNNHSGRFVADYNEFIDVNTRWVGVIPIISDRGDNAPTDAAADGSMYIRLNGITANVLYMREAGAWRVVG